MREPVFHRNIWRYIYSSSNRTETIISLLIILGFGDAYTHGWTGWSLVLESGLTPIWHQATLLTNTDLLLPGPWWVIFRKIIITIQKFIFEEICNFHQCTNWSISLVKSQCITNMCKYKYISFCCFGCLRGWLSAISSMEIYQLIFSFIVVCYLIPAWF